MMLSFRTKLWLPLVMSLACLVGLSVTDAYRTREIRLEERQRDLAHTTDLVLGVAKTFSEEASAGNLTTAEAQKRAIEVVRHMRYGRNGSGYFSILNSRGVILMHPIRSKLEGRSLREIPGEQGAQYIQALIEQIKGEGFVRYQTLKPGTNETVPKISYCKAYPSWDWIIQTGVYVDDIDAAFYRTLYQSAAILVAAAALLSTIVVLLNRGILRSLGGEPAYAAEVASRIAGNDLTTAVETVLDDRASLLYSIKRMQERLVGTVRAIKSSTESIVIATGQIAAGNLDLSRRTEEQAAALGQTAASMEELTSTVNQNADNARRARQVAYQTVHVAERGGDVVLRVVDTMREINASSDRIANIVDLIQGIAFQTNILALNAAVEAARAGEQGRGFAVVSGEVRSLAQRSASASKEIKQLIEESVQRVKDGTELVNVAGVTMQEIMQSVQQVTDMMGEIAEASIEQSKGIGQVNQAVSQMDAVTQQNASLVEQAAAAASALDSQAGELNSAVALFKLS
jgi:methyl-accepting chemotaxis protein